MSRRALNPDACVPAEAVPEAIPRQAIPVDELLFRAIAALSACDAAGLRALEALARQAASPLDGERCRKLHAIFAALLAATARNLRMARRASIRSGAANPYRPADSIAAFRR